MKGLPAESTVCATMFCPTIAPGMFGFLLYFVCASPNTIFCAAPQQQHGLYCLGWPPNFFYLHVFFNPMTPGRVHCQRCESAANVLCFCISPPIHDFVANLAEFFFPGRHFLCQSFERHAVELCHFALALHEPNLLPMPPIPTTGICMHPHRLTRTVNAPLTVDMLTAPRWACKRPRGMITNPGQRRSTIAGLAPDLTVPIGM